MQQQFQQQQKQAKPANALRNSKPKVQAPLGTSPTSGWLIGMLLLSIATCTGILCREKSFIKITSKNTENRFKTRKNPIFSKTSKRCVQMHPNGFEWIRMGLNASESLEKLAKTSKKLRKLREKKFVNTFFTVQYVLSRWPLKA